MVATKKAKRQNTPIILNNHSVWVGQMRSSRKYYCAVCGIEIDREEFDDHEGMCWECWDNQLTEESDSVFEELI